MELVLTAAKYSTSVGVSTAPRFKRRVFSDDAQKQCDKFGILIEKQTGTDFIFIAFKSTASLLDLGLDWIIHAIPDWFLLTFGTTWEVDLVD